jgi:phosphatidylglycerol lysyltransferase
VHRSIADADVDPERERVLVLLRRHGWNATSFQILEPGFRYWFDGEDACVGYVDTGSAWVAAGPPVAPVERLAAVATSFVAAARSARRRATWFGTEQRFGDVTGWSQLRIGEQPTWDPAAWPGVVAARKSLREQLRRARAKGVVVRALAAAELAPDHPTRRALDALIARWHASQPIAPMAFLVQVDPFTAPAERRCFVAERDGAPVGMLGIIPIYARRGWFFEDFIRDPDAPNGTIELLVDAGMRAAASESIALVTLGLAPLGGEVTPWLRGARRLGRALYDFDGLRAFKAKFTPRTWDPIFLTVPPRASTLIAVVETLRAFARGGLLRFGLETLLRAPAIVVRVLAVLLVVWTALLALPANGDYFPAAACQYGWVAFDVALAGALFALVRSWRRGLADVVAGAVTIDACATLLQVVVYNAPRARGAGDIVVFALAVLAPTLAALLLWNARPATR